MKLFYLSKYFSDLSQICLGKGTQQEGKKRGETIIKECTCWHLYQLMKQFEKMRKKGNVAHGR